MTSGLAIDVPVPATAGPRASPSYLALFDALFGASVLADGDRPSWALNDGQLTIRVTSEAALSLRTAEQQSSPLRIAGSSDGAAVRARPRRSRGVIVLRVAVISRRAVRRARSHRHQPRGRGGQRNALEGICRQRRSVVARPRARPAGQRHGGHRAGAAAEGAAGPGVQALEIVYDRRAQTVELARVCARQKRQGGHRARVPRAARRL